MQAPEYRVATANLDAERERFAGAAARASKQVAKLQTKAKTLPGAAGEELGYLLDAYLQMLKGSRLIRGVERRIVEQRINAEAAVQQEIAEIVRGFSSVNDSYLAARIEDIREVGHRLVRNLLGTPYKPFSTVPAGAVILAEELTPADTALLDPKRVGASRPSWAAPKAIPRSWRGRSACPRSLASPA